jgi:phosphoribosyl-AMP cyclohydrolase
MTIDTTFQKPGDARELEQGLALTPRFDAHGLIPAIVTDADAGDVLMFAWMNAEALAETLQTGQACYYSRSRQKLWRKGEESGNRQTVVELRVDCDQDAILLRVRMAGHGVACHTGRRSCFYRAAALDGSRSLRLVGDGPQFDPAKVYRKG